MLPAVLGFRPARFAPEKPPRLNPFFTCGLKFIA
jgi:hypothetical protein